jgi:hypothetical protein
MMLATSRPAIADVKSALVKREHGAAKGPGAGRKMNEKVRAASLAAAALLKLFKCKTSLPWRRAGTTPATQHAELTWMRLDPWLQIEAPPPCSNRLPLGTERRATAPGKGSNRA